MMKEYIVAGIALVSFIVGCGSGAKSEEDTNTAPVAKSLRVDVQKNNKKIIEKLNDKKNPLSFEELLQKPTIRSNVKTKIKLEGSDGEDDNLTYSIVSNPSHGRLIGTAPNLRYLSDKDFFGSDSFSYKVNDGKQDSNVATVEINVKLYKLLTQTSARMGANNEVLSTNVMQYTYYDNALMRANPYDEFTYNDKDELVIKLHRYGGKTVYTYDAHHKIVSSKEYDADGAFVDDTIESYDNNNTYDDQGNLKEMQRIFFGETQLGGLFLYTYDTNNTLLTYSEQHFVSNGERYGEDITYNVYGDEIDYIGLYQGVVNYRRTKTYNSFGYLTKTLLAMADKGYDYRFLYEDFDAHGNHQVEHYAKISDNVYQDSPPSADVNTTKHYQYSYDAQGNTISEKILREDGSVLEEFERTYDMQGNILVKKFSYSGVPTGRWVYTWREFQ